jgi:hypothetical protein
VNKP